MLKNFSFATLIKKTWIFFPFFFYVLIAQALRRSHGHLRFNHLVFLTLGIIFFSIWTMRPPKQWDQALTEKVFQGIWILFSLFLFLNNEMIYGLKNYWTSTIYISLICNLVFSVSSLFLRFKKYSLLLGVTSLMLTISMVIPSSPAPQIDVWVYAQLGADYFLRGENPYSFHYPDLYNGRYELTNGFCYWPTATHFFTISKFLFHDVRWALVFSHFFSLYGLLKLSSRTFLKEKMLIPIVWFSFPVTFFVLEQSWVDGLMTPLVVWFTIFLINKNLVKAAITLGFMCMVKQYMVFFAILSFFYILKVYKLKKTFQYVLTSTLVGLLLTSPFLLWDAPLFIKKTVTDLLKLGFRDDALSWVAYLYRFYGLYLKGLWASIFYLIALVLLSVRVYLCRENPLQTLFSSFVIIFFIVFLLGKQAFCNYYYMATSLLFICIILKISPNHDGYKLK